MGPIPETRYTSDGTQVSSFNVAVNDRPRRAQGAEGGQGGPGSQPEETTTWFRVSAWRRQAEIVSQYLKKGSSVFVSGNLTVREYTGNDGQKRFSLDVSMDEMQMLTPRGMEEQGSGFEGGSPSYGSRPAGGQSAPQGSRPAPAAAEPYENEDDVPF